MSQTDQHQLVHQVYHLCPRHEFLLEGFYPHREGGGIHQKSAFRTDVVHDFLNILLKVSLEQTVSLIEHKELTSIEQMLIALDKVLQSPRRAYHQMNVPLLYLSVIFLDHCPTNEQLDIDLGEFGNLQSEVLHLQCQLSGRDKHHAFVLYGLPWMYLEV